MRGNRIGLLALSLAASVGLGACDVGSGPDDRTRVSVFITDAPGDVESVWLDIDGLTLVGGEDGSVDLPGEFGDLVEVTELVDRAQEIVDDAELEPGSFGQLRFLLGGAVLLTKDGRVFATDGATLPEGLEADEVGELMCPSCSRSGLKVVLHGASGDIGEGDDVGLVLDFDVAQSFGHQAGKSGKWVMRPVIHATRVDDDGAGETSAIQGTVAIQTDGQGQPTFAVPECPAGTARSIADFVPTATAQNLQDSESNPVVRSGTVQASDGAFSINFVAPDTYTLGFAEVDLGDFNLVWTATVAPTEVTVVEGADVGDVLYTLTGASCVAG